MTRWHPDFLWLSLLWAVDLSRVGCADHTDIYGFWYYKSILIYSSFNIENKFISNPESPLEEDWPMLPVIQTNPVSQLVL